MFAKFVIFTLTAAFLALATVAYGAEPDGFKAYVVQKGDTWGKVAPSKEAQLLVMRVNKIDALFAGRKILIPIDTSAYQYQPVPSKYSAPPGKRIIVFFLKEQYFGAYDENGSLFKWGPISSGSGGKRKTPIGTYLAQDRDKDYWSRKYKAPMPYAVRFDGPYFFHQQKLPGYPTSKGCVRLLMDDAREMFSFVRWGDIVKVAASVSSAL
jgi:lipoprotein-anchoring transpeptidase ErfK/SrfK